jgi:hypothetical protein
MDALFQQNFNTDFNRLEYTIVWHQISNNPENTFRNLLRGALEAVNEPDNYAFRLALQYEMEKRLNLGRPFGRAFYDSIYELASFGWFAYKDVGHAFSNNRTLRKIRFSRGSCAPIA